MLNKVELTTEESKKWYRIRIPYLDPFYNTEIYLVGKHNDSIYALKGEEKEIVCVRIMWTPYNLVALEELLRNNQYLRLKGLKRFEEEGENIMSRLVSMEERSLPKGIDFKRILNYEGRQKLYERRLKITKAIPIMLREITLLEDEHQNQILLHITQKKEFIAGLCMLIDQIDSVLQKDDEHHKVLGFQTVKTLRFYPTDAQMWAEMPLDIIREASEEHKECMKSLDDVKIQSQDTEATKTHRGWKNIKADSTK